MSNLRLTDNQRAQLRAVLKLIDDCKEINHGMVIRLLEARGLKQDAATNRVDEVEGIKANPGDFDHDPAVVAEMLADAEKWSAADELESQLEANLDESRDYVYFEFDAIREMGEEFFGDAWKEAAK